jgi:uncharacterized protein YutE (UPF0331/DUF86 family)
VEPDRDIVDLRLARIEDCLGQLEPFRTLGELQFTSRYDRYHEAKKLVAAALNTVHQIARNLQRTIDGNGGDPVDFLRDRGVLESDLALRLSTNLRLLGTLSRAHFDEDRDIVYHFIRSDLGDLVAFGRAVTDWLDGRDGD